MSEALSIKRRKSEASETSFASLRSQAIKLAQQLCGEQWTDYNLHDPGITILEQLIYAMTDLIYRSEFEVADYLINDAGRIDFEAQALQRPERIFASRPTTLVDYRKAILNAVPELDNVWLMPKSAADSHCLGLYQLALKLEHGLSEVKQGIVLEKVRRFYNRSRNLCEDLAEITIVEGLDYSLCAEIEIGSRRRPVDILAEIYFNCSRRISGGITLTAYDQALTESESLDQLFNGPFTDHGIFNDEDFAADNSEFLVSNLFSVVNAINGVDHVRGIYLARDGEEFHESIVCDTPETAINLLLPKHADEIKIVLTTNGRVLRTSLAEVRAKFDELSFGYHSSRSTPQDLSLVYELPEGKARMLSQYSSIQNQFPLNYGVSAQGVPESAPAAVKAKAKQLKAYLILFEQMMANYLANLASLGQLFSVNDQQGQTYAINCLKTLQIAGLDAVYPHNGLEVIGEISGNYENATERRGRLLDYLLALYGESFSQNSLRHFNYYYSPAEIEQNIVDNKTEFLKSVVELGRDRAAGADYSALSWKIRGQSGLQQRVGMLLGFKQLSARSLTMTMLKQGLKLCRHDVFEHLKAGSPELELIDMQKLDTASQASFQTVAAIDTEVPFSLNEIREQIGAANPLKNNLLSDLLLRDGIYLDRYQLGSLTDGQDYQLCFQPQQDQYWYLGTFTDREAGNRAANALQQFLIHLNSESEGMHVLEHVLLRPIGRERHAGVSFTAGEDFYSFRISVVFPAWTARCHDQQFRMLAEETVSINAPAHVYPEFYWLDFHKMYAFEMLYEKWMVLKSKRSMEAAEINQAADMLIAFLLENREHKEMRR